MLSLLDDGILPPDQTPSHGNCAASKAVGVNLGVAKKADLVVVPTRITFADILLSIRLVIEDIIEDMERGKVVVSFSLGGD